MKISEKLATQIAEKGHVELDGGKFWLTVLPTNDESFVLNEKFRQQLKDEGRYGLYTAFITAPLAENERASMSYLPIYGNIHKYVTTFVGFESKEAAIIAFVGTLPNNFKKRMTLD